MTIIAERGYLETDYLTLGYMAGEVDDATGMQVRTTTKNATGIQAKIFPLQHIIHEKYLVEDYLTTPYLASKFCALQGMQVSMNLVSPGATSMQVDARPSDTSQLGMQIKAFPLQHIIHEKYLTEDYLTQSYLGYKYCALQGMQVNMFIDRPEDDKFQGMQVDQKIFDQDATGMQALMRVFKNNPTSMQVNQLTVNLTGLSTLMSIYNITQLRILCDFASRGTPGLAGLNWTSPQGVDAGDFSLNNLNTDLVEQRTQSPVGVIALWELRCDTGQTNTFFDTIGMLNHNLTTSATVTVQVSDDSGFGSIKDSFVMTTELINSYYIAPTLPQIPGRYVRFLIQDPTNSEGQLKIGVIVFGTATILPRSACYDLPVTYGQRHFKDSLKTEGFTANSNDRALRKILSLSFTNLELDGAAYGQFQDYFSSAKTDLKCLIIPKPERASALAVFSKLIQLPDEEHRSIDVNDWWVDLSLDYDESE